MIADLSLAFAWVVAVSGGVIVAVRLKRRIQRSNNEQAVDLKRELQRLESHVETRLDAHAAMIEALAEVRRSRETEAGRPFLRLVGRVVEAWVGLAAVDSVARWVYRHKAAAITLAGVAVVSPAIVLLPQDAQMGPQAAPPPITTTRTPSQHPTARGPTAPASTSTAPAPTETTSTPPPSTTGIPATGARTTATAPTTTARPSSTPTPATASSSPKPVDVSVAAPPTSVAPTTTAPVPAEAQPLDGGKPPKDKGKGKPASVAVTASSLSSGLCLPLILLDVCLRGGSHGQL